MLSESEVPHGTASAIRFTGRWQEYAGIAAVNLLLTIVTLGIYRFWAIARTRRYLWSNTTVIDDELEWTGTGGEMFIGFLIVVGIFLGTIAAIFGIAYLVGQWFVILAMVAFYIFILWAVNFAQFRALKYRLSRTYWRGIRGGSDESGVGYGWAALGRFFAAGLTLSIMTPWALIENWNDRMNNMSFGPHRIQSDANTEGLFLRWFGILGAYIVGLILMVAIDGRSMAETAAAGGEPQFGLGFIPLLAIIGFALIAFWALFFRKITEGFEMGGLTARLHASTLDWVKFYAKIIGLTIVTLGLGSLMWRYWQWEFVIDRLELYGEIDLDHLTQSDTIAPRDAEGFAEAFDIGAF
jgi:uncharacterized membrane protein YjgN (DUF898 family)